MNEAAENNYFGKDCPKGMVQVEFVSTDGERHSKYGWKPGTRAFVDIYIDGQRFHVQVGDFHDGVAQRRGLHVIGPLDMNCEKTSCNAASIFLAPNTH